MIIIQNHVGNSSSTSYYIITNCNQEVDGIGGFFAQMKSKFHPSRTWNSHAKCELSFKHEGTGSQRLLSFEYCRQTRDGGVDNAWTSIEEFGPWNSIGPVDVTTLGVGQHILEGAAYGAGTGVTLEVIQTAAPDTWQLVIWVYTLMVVAGDYAQDAIALRNVSVVS
ncbi:MAG: hypothetical protein WC959_05365 [Kiritimatiellales bacterium]